MKRVGGSFGARNGAAWSREWADYRLRRDGDAVQSNTASTQETVTSPSQEAMQRAIAAETCPFCGAGPYKNLGLHTNIAHGVSAAELREMSGLARVCAESHSQKCRENLEGREDRSEIASRGGRESMRKQMEEGRRPGVDNTSLATAAAKAKWAKVAAERDPDVCERAKRGEKLVTIAERWGITTHTVYMILKRHGVEPTLVQTNEERRARLEKYREAGRQASQERAAQERARKLRRWRELGGDWPALIAFAEEEGISRKAARAFLKAQGIEMDGRTLSPERGHSRPDLKGKANTACRTASPEAFAEIRQLLERGDMTQRQIAERCGVSQSIVSRVKTGWYVE